MKKILAISFYLIVCIGLLIVGRNSWGNAIVPVFLAFNGAFLLWLVTYIKRKEKRVTG